MIVQRSKKRKSSNSRKQGPTKKHRKIVPIMWLKWKCNKELKKYEN